jgi:SAM-dependent methyltransferase
MPFAGPARAQWTLTSGSSPRSAGRAARLLATAYFELSYALLQGSRGGRLFLSRAAPSGTPVHGYLTPDDLSALLLALDPKPSDRLLDLGCGVGGIAIEIHRRTGAAIVGVDVSTRAVAAAAVRARRARVDASVQFLAGDLARPPQVGATSAYAIDSLMFLPDLPMALRGIGEALGSEARLFGTLLVIEPGGAERIARTFRAANVWVEELNDVTAAFDESNRRRATVARAVFHHEATTIRGRAAMLLVLVEEALVRRAIEAGRLKRWRFVISFPNPVHT